MIIDNVEIHDTEGQMAALDLDNVIAVGCDTESAATLYKDAREGVKAVEEHYYLAFFPKNGGDQLLELQSVQKGRKFHWIVV